MQKVSNFRHWWKEEEDQDQMWKEDQIHIVLICPGMPRRVWRAKSYVEARKILDSAGLQDWQSVTWAAPQLQSRPYMLRLLRDEWMRLTGVNDDEAFHAALRADRLGWILDTAFEYLMKGDSHEK